MFESKKQFLEITKISHSLQNYSDKDNILTLSNYRELLIKKIFGDRLNCNHLDTIFSSKKIIDC
jgi:hypothetical protein